MRNLLSDVEETPIHQSRRDERRQQARREIPKRPLRRSMEMEDWRSMSTRALASALQRLGKWAMVNIDEEKEGKQMARSERDSPLATA